MRNWKKFLMIGLCAGLVMMPVSANAQELNVGGAVIEQSGSMEVLNTSESEKESGSEGSKETETPAYADEEAKQQAIQQILDYMVTICRNSNNESAVKDIANAAIAQIGTTTNTNPQKGTEYSCDKSTWSTTGLSELVAKTKSRMDAYDNANYKEEEKEPETPAPNDYVQVGGNWVTPQCTYGQAVSLVLPIVNMAKENAYDVIVTPILDTNPENWPFEITQSSYTVKLDCLAGENVEADAYARRQEITWNLKTRQDVTNGYKKVGFLVQYTNSADAQVNTTIYIYVKCNGAAGSGDGTNASTPRLIVTGFETDPEEVKAGDEFDLVLHMKNTSARTAVSNIQFTLKAATEGTGDSAVYAAFLPTSGSDTLFVDKIPANGTQDISIRMKAKADLNQKPYALDISMDFEDDKLKAYSAAASVSIPVHQDARFEVSTPEVQPGSIDVGSESNIMFNIYNTGKTTLYNVSVKFQADSISGGDAFVGNISPGGSGQIDTMITGAQATMDEGKVKAVITYEDSDTKSYTYETEFELFVQEPVYEDMDYDMPVEEAKSSFPKWLIGLLAALLAVLAIIFGTLASRKKKKARAAELAEDALIDAAIEEQKKADKK